jgi:hypothetical protein
MSTVATRPPSRVWAALCAAGRCATAHLATENGWFWSYSLSYPFVPPPYPPYRTSEPSGGRRPV